MKNGRRTQVFKASKENISFMKIYGADLMKRLSAQDHFSAKVVFNENGAVFFPISQQHRDTKVEGVSYEDDYKGNALAGIISNGKIEIRYHSAFSSERVAALAHSLFLETEVEFLKSIKIYYQGKPL
jgi:hypothetical protein